jgi:hypothetical protein
VPQEHITNSLQKQLNVLQNEKQKLEKELQHEHAEHALAMSRLGAAFTEKLSERSRLKESFTVLENQLEAEQELIVHRMGAQVRNRELRVERPAPRAARGLLTSFARR